jgi:histidinol-phosphate aminotransferase|tara:strand:- start:5516 stop:6610 length:1095 start_codon:yes stop_codon:yes gene_type:complete
LKYKLRIKQSLKNFNSYVPDEIDFLFRLNANESPFDDTENILRNLYRKNNRRYLQSNSINRYPDPIQKDLRKKVSSFHGVNQNQIVFGNGSDELILYLLLVLTGRTSKVMYLEPSFSMYKILTAAVGLKGIKVELNKNFQIDIANMISKIRKDDPDLIFIPTPNNPTGNSFDPDDIKKIIKTSKGLVIIDEAYADYSTQSYFPLLKKNENLLIMRTMSKIGFASLRLGYLVGDKKIINEINKIRLPYNISTLSQVIASDYFVNQQLSKQKITIIKKERIKLMDFLNKFSKVQTFESDSNFILIRLKESKSLNNFLRKNNIIVRSFDSHKRLQNCLRLTVGLPSENKKLMSTFSKFIKKSTKKKY